MYPESNATKQDYNSKAKIALIAYMISNMDKETSWHVEPLLSHQMNMIQAARRIFDKQGVPREHHNDFLKQPLVMGSDCVKKYS